LRYFGTIIKPVVCMYLHGAYVYHFGRKKTLRASPIHRDRSKTCVEGCFKMVRVTRLWALAENARPRGGLGYSTVQYLSEPQARTTCTPAYPFWMVPGASAGRSESSDAPSRPLKKNRRGRGSVRARVCERMTKFLCFS
jgi:hypothetical protein